MKRFFTSIAMVGLSLVLTGQAIAQENVKMALVDYARVQRDYHRTELEQTSFREMQDSKQKEIEERQAQFLELSEEQKSAGQMLQDPTLSEGSKSTVLEEAKEREGQLRSLQKELMEMEQKSQMDLTTRANEIQRSLTQEIYDVIGEVAESKDLDLVLNRTFGINGVPTLAYSSTKTLEDISEAVLEVLNKNAPEGWVPPSERAGEAGAEGEAPASE